MFSVASMCMQLSAQEIGTVVSCTCACRNIHVVTNFATRFKSLDTSIATAFLSVEHLSCKIAERQKNFYSWILLFWWKKKLLVLQQQSLSWMFKTDQLLNHKQSWRKLLSCSPPRCCFHTQTSTKVDYARIYRSCDKNVTIKRSLTTCSTVLLVSYVHSIMLLCWPNLSSDQWRVLWWKLP